jgi:hypothetical protein
MTPEELQASRARVDVCFRAPWVASEPWTVEPEFNDDDDDEEVEICSVDSPDEYPDGQRVAECFENGTTRTPGLEGFARAHAEFIAHARTDVPRLHATIAARDERLAVVARMLAENGCDCAKREWFDRTPCLACRIEAAMKEVDQ